MVGGAVLVAAARDDVAPSVPDGFVLRPTFQTTRGDAPAGTAFAITLPGRPRAILLSALHLLGESGGLKEDIPAKDVPGALKGVVVSDCFDRRRPPIRLGKEVVSIPDAASFPGPSKAGDIVAILVPTDVKLETRRLAAKMPAKGDRVWLAAEVFAGAPKGRRLHPARIDGTEAGYLLYVFEEADIELVGTSGGPVLNAAGEVVAIHLSGGKTPDGKLLGGGNPASRFRPILEAAVAKGPG